METNLPEQSSQSNDANSAQVLHKRPGMQYLGEVKTGPNSDRWQAALTTALRNNWPYAFVKQNDRQYLAVTTLQVVQENNQGGEVSWYEIPLYTPCLYQECPTCHGTRMVHEHETISRGTGSSEGRGSSVPCPECAVVKPPDQYESLAAAIIMLLTNKAGGFFDTGTHQEVSEMIRKHCTPTDDCISDLASLSVTSMAPGLHRQAKERVISILKRHAKA